MFSYVMSLCLCILSKLERTDKTADKLREEEWRTELFVGLKLNTDPELHIVGLSRWSPDGSTV